MKKKHKTLINIDPEYNDKRKKKYQFLLASIFEG